ncbi:MAG: hypothetical protein QOF16_1305 [Actinomycetota bacterium]|jgi:hypothetical protein|nr:hypothetical protein [Actinomycetota bacterium]
MVGRTACLGAGLLLLLTMASCRIPADQTTSGSTPTPPSTLSFEQRFGKDVPQEQESEVVAKLRGKVIYENTLAQLVGTPSPSAMPLRSGTLEPGPYDITAVQHPCPQSCATPGKTVLSRCHIQVIVVKDQPVDAIIHIGRKSCFIEVG